MATHTSSLTVFQTRAKSAIRIATGRGKYKPSKTVSIPSSTPIPKGVKNWDTPAMAKIPIVTGKFERGKGCTEIIKK